MPTYYTYSPFTGTVWGKATYCNGTTHTVVSSLGGSLPIDIGGIAQGTGVYFRCSSNVGSIRTTQVTGVCATTGAPWTNGVKVEMFSGSNATGTLIGTVGYGHLESRVANGVRNATTSLLVGTMPADCACGCSSGIHVHMQCGSSYTRSITSVAGCAGQTVYAGSTWIYQIVTP